jgi:nucleoid-associated protein YgaU
MSNRYSKEEIFINNSENYIEIFDTKKINNIKTYFLQIFNEIDESVYQKILYTVKDRETLHSISSKFYGSPKFWWVVGLSNNIKSNFELVTGQTIFIYTPLQLLLKNMLG